MFRVCDLDRVYLGIWNMVADISDSMAAVFTACLQTPKK